MEDSLEHLHFLAAHHSVVNRLVSLVEVDQEVSLQVLRRLVVLLALRRLLDSNRLEAEASRHKEAFPQDERSTMS